MNSAARAGRKPIAATGECMKGRAVRMTDAEWEKCKGLGGAAWIRARLAAEVAEITPCRLPKSRPVLRP